MDAIAIPSMHERIAVAALRWSIEGYRAWLSPWKGFSCAHRLRHGSLSCSAFALEVLGRGRLADFAPAMRERFAACRAAAGYVRETRADRARRRDDCIERWCGWVGHPCGQIALDEMLGGCCSLAADW